MSRPPSADTVRSLLRQDVAAMSAVKTGINQADDHSRGVADAASLPGFWAVALWRVATALHRRGLRPLSRLCYALNVSLTGADLASGATVGPGLVIAHPVGVAISKGTVIGSRCRVMGLVRIGGSGGSRPGHPRLGDDVWVLDGAKVFGPVTIGDRSVIGAGCVISQDIPPDTLVLLGSAACEVRLRPRDKPESS